MAQMRDLPQDVFDLILLCIPDFGTLSATLRSSKLFYDVFNTHPRSIVLAIAYNVVGPALPQAAKLAHDHYDEDYETPIDETSVLDQPLSRHLCEVLQKNASLVTKFEDLFSLRHKDRTSPTTKLTEAESLRFHRAIYRFWLYCLCLMEDYGDDYILDEDHSEYTQNARLYLEGLPTDELLEVERVAKFLNEMCEWTATSSSLTLHLQEIWPLESAVLRGPDTIWSDYEKNQYYAFDNAGHAALYKVHLSSALARKHVSDEERELKLSKAIIEAVHGSDDVCHRCNSARGVHLWGRSNWHLLRGLISIGSLAVMFDGNLPRNSFEMTQLVEHIHERDSLDRMTFSWSDFLQELCDMDVDTEGRWDSEQWYCMDCMLHLVRSRLRKWWIATKTRLYGPLKENCWYGFNCRTQVHRRRHAEKLNHLCEPTRGEGA